RQREGEGRAAARLALDPDLSALQLDELARDGEAQAVPSTFLPPSRPVGTPRTLLVDPRGRSHSVSPQAPHHRIEGRRSTLSALIAGRSRCFHRASRISLWPDDTRCTANRLELPQPM